jgi:hypothetical protein
MVEQTPNEHAYFKRIRQHVVTLYNYLSSNAAPIDDDPAAWFEFIAQIRAIQGNISNDQSFLSTLLAKAYLMRRFNLAEFDAAEKAQGTPGLDIDVSTEIGERIVGEIKTTIPYGMRDLGAQQKRTFREDFAKLNAAEARYKFFFVTSRKTFEIVQQRYAAEIPEVEIVLLIDR